MARRGNSRRGQRDTNDIANTHPLHQLDHVLLAPDPYPTAPLSRLSPDPLLDYQMPDRRLFHPEAPFHPPLYMSGVPADIDETDTGVARPFSRPQANVPQQRKGVYYPAFTHPNRVAVCVRRQQRREVLHALRRTGRGGGKRRFNYNSKVRC